MKKFSVICALLLSTGCQSIQDTAVEVDKALYTASEAVARRDDVTGERALNYISDAEEIKKGQENFSAITAEAKNERILLGPGDPQYDRVQMIFERIIPVSHLKESKTAQFAVIDHDLFNAFAFGGGKLVVFTGLSNQLDDDELAIIIGHEIAHNTLSHLAEQEAGLTLKDAIDGGVQTGYSEAFSNLHEQQADQVGILYAALAGYDPYAGERLWSRLAIQSPKSYRYFLTHPSHKDRAKQNRQVADLVAEYYIADQLNLDAAQILVCNELYCKSDKPQIRGGEGVVSSRWSK